MDLKYDMGYSLRGVVLITEIGIPLFKKKISMVLSDVCTIHSQCISHCVIGAPNIMEETNKL